MKCNKLILRKLQCPDLRTVYRRECKGTAIHAATAWLLSVTVPISSLRISTRTQRVEAAMLLHFVTIVTLTFDLSTFDLK